MKETLIFRDFGRKAELEPLCRKILRQYQLPSLDFVGIFDDQERQTFLQHPKIGPNFCGLHAPVKRYGIGNGAWPQDLIEIIWDMNTRCFAYDVAIYIRKRTADATVGAIITFAHELQHLMQYGHSFRVWRAHQYLQHIAVPKLDKPRPWHFPVEYEAQLVSKRNAETILGTNEVKRYAQEQVDNNCDPEKWLFFLGLDTAEQFNLLNETNKWVERYRTHLTKEFPHSYRAKELNFANDLWWK